MAKTVEIDIVVNGKMQKATVSAKKLQKALDGVDTSQKKTNKSSGELYRNQQGVAQNTANTTKAFAKQAQGMGGLVRTYATLAANAFAASAAFNLLSRNAALKQLEAGLDAVGTAAGRNLEYLSSQLIQVTDNAISMESAFRATAQATSAGFDGGQLLRLAGVAKGASLALGRDMTDALDRLVRGTAKVEPEILDELGIFVRLDDAVQAYATSLGKNANELTQYQRSQAFLNATLEQGEKKFSLIKSQVDVNPYDQLSASLANLRENFLDIVNTILGPFIGAVADSKAALIGLTTLFASTISGALLGGIQEQVDMAMSAAEVALGEMKELQKGDVGANLKQQAKVGGMIDKIDDKIPKGYADLSDKLREGTANADDFKKANTSLERSLGQTNRRIKNLGKENKALAGAQDEASKKQRAANKAEIAGLQQKRRELTKLKIETQKLEVTQTAASQKNLAYLNAEKIATLAQADAKVMTTIANSTVATGFGLGAVVDNLKENWTKAGKSIGGRIDAISRGLSGLFQVGLKALPWIGGAILAIGLAWKAWQKLTEKSVIEQKIDEIVKSFEKLSEISATYQMQLAVATNENERFTASLASMAGILGQLKSAFATLQTTKMDEFIKASQKAVDSGLKAEKYDDPYAVNDELGIALSLGAAADAKEAKEKQLEAFEFSQQEIKRIVLPYAAMLEADESLKNLVGAEKLEKIKKIGDEGAMSVAEMSKAMETLVDPILAADAAVKGLDQNFANLDKALIQLGGKSSTIFTPTLEVLSAIENELQAIDDVAEGGLSMDKLNDTQQKAINRMMQGMREMGEVEQYLPGVDSANLTLALKGPQGVLKEYKRIFTELDAAYRVQKTELKTLQAEAKQLGAIRRMAPEFEQAVIDKQKEIIKQKLDMVNAEEKRAKGTLEGAELEAQLAELEAKRKLILMDQVEAHDEKYRLAKANGELLKMSIDDSKKELDIQKGLLAIEEQRAQRAVSRTVREYAADNQFSSNFSGRREQVQATAEYAAALKLEESRRNAIETERQIKLATIDMEYMLLDAKYDYLKAEAAGNDPLIKRIEKAQRTLGLPQFDEATGAAVAGTEDPAGMYARARGLVDAQAKAANEQIDEDLADLRQKYEDTFSSLDDIMATVATSFESALNDSVNAIFDSISDKTMDLNEKLKEIGRSFLQTIQKAVTQQLIVNPILDMLFPDRERGASPNNPMWVAMASGAGAGSTGAAADTPAGVLSTIMGGGQRGHSKDKPLYVCCVCAGEDAAPGVQDQIIDKVLKKKDPTQKEGAAEAAEQTTFFGKLKEGFMYAKNSFTQMFSNIFGEGGIVKNLFSKIFVEGGLLSGGLKGIMGGIGGFFSKIIGTKTKSETTMGYGIHPTTGLPIEETITTNTPGTGLIGMFENLFGEGGTISSMFGKLFGEGGMLKGMFGKLFGGEGGIGGMLSGLFGGGGGAAAAGGGGGLLGGGGGGIMALLKPFLSMIPGIGPLLSFLPFKNGGIMDNGRKIPGYAVGGIANGPKDGHPAMLHGKEAVVPLPKGNAIPVDMKGAGGTQNNNVSVNVAVGANGSSQTSVSGGQGADLGAAVAQAVQKELQNQKRAGGILNPYGAT